MDAVTPPLTPARRKELEAVQRGVVKDVHIGGSRWRIEGARGQTIHKLYNDKLIDHKTVKGECVYYLTDAGRRALEEDDGGD